MRGWMMRARVKILALGAAGVTFVLSGCDASVRDTVLSGVEGAATTLVATFMQAFFETLLVEEETATVVRAVVEQAARFA